MPKGHREASATGGATVVGRKGFASLLFAVARPTDARASALDGNALRLTLRFASQEIAVGEIEAVEVQRRWRWGGVRIRTSSGDSEVSGLSRRDATELAAAVENARLKWWGQALSGQRRALRAASVRLAPLARPKEYLGRRTFSALLREARAAAAPFPGRWPEGLPGSRELEALERLRAFLAEPEGVRRKANETFVGMEMDRSEAFLDRVEMRPLTGEQRRAVAVDDDRNLVVAAAGSGKTSVMVAKAGWLVESGRRRPEELLLLAFARNARDELAERVAKRLGLEAAGGQSVQTFHSLGLSIIGEAEGRKPALARTADDPSALLDLLKGIFGELLGDPEHGRALVQWLAYGSAPYRAEHEFKTRGEYWDYIRSYEIRSLNGERVKSFEECRIANFLYLNGVPYEYERPYEHDTATAKKVQYRPDFYLTEAGIYIEHFALSATGDTPPFIDREQYTASRAWKLELHARHGTRLVETFSHEQASGQLMRNLARRLREHGVVLASMPADEIFDVLNEQGRVAPFTRLVATFLQHFKGSRASLDQLARRAANAQDPHRAVAFLRVFRPILERYEASLSEAGQIDFHDMINRATDHVASGRYRSPSGYILVDEFQDISSGRAALLKALLDQSDGAQLFAVGDDWQAIYRFAGADIAVMREFEKRFGRGARSDLETTFRCSEGVSEVATRFVLGNPAQIGKAVRTERCVDGPGVWIGFAGDEGASLLDEALTRIAADAPANGGKPTVLLLGRYRHLEPDMRRLSRAHPALNLSYSTVHGAKGLEADYVVVLGVCAGRYGFPSEITDDPLLELVLAAPEHHPNAEERRLLYVALTRARRRACVLAEGGARSPFVKELLEGDYHIEIFGRQTAGDVPCPECREGRLVQRKGEDGSVFYGCSNFPYCDHTQRPCPVCGAGLPVRGRESARCGACGRTFEGCPACDGWLQSKPGPYGTFLGCSSWPVCDYTRSARQTASG